MTTLNQRLTAFTKQGKIYKRRGPASHKESFQLNDSVSFIGAVMTNDGETNAYDVTVCSYNEKPTGILVEVADDANNLSYDAQNPLTDNTKVNLIHPTELDEVIVCLGTGKGCTRRDVIVVDVDYPGFVEAMAANNESIAQLPPFRILGEAMKTYSAVSAKAQYMWMKRRT